MKAPRAQGIWPGRRENFNLLVVASPKGQSPRAPSSKSGIFHGANGELTWIASLKRSRITSGTVVACRFRPKGTLSRVFCTTDFPWLTRKPWSIPCWPSKLPEESPHEWLFRRQSCEDLIANGTGYFKCAILLDGGFATKRLQNAAYRGLHRITHHDLRHLFAARCVEGGVDVSTAAICLGAANRSLLHGGFYG